MKIARIAGTAGPEFAVKSADHDSWTAVRSLGFDPRDVQSLIGSYAAISRAYASTSGTAISGPLTTPVVRPGKIMGVGLNYLAHIDEVGKPRPTEPLVFAKYSSSVSGPCDDIEFSRDITEEVDYEVELAVIIGKETRRATPEDALASVFGYCVANDVSARDVQRSQSQISRSKSLDTFCPLGPWITTVDEVPDPHSLTISTSVNGEIRQDSNTSDMLFDVAHMIVHLSSAMTLQVGDVILTGTPAGVGSGMDPQTFLRHGDVVRCEIEHLGILENAVVELGGTSHAPSRGARQGRSGGLA